MTRQPMVDHNLDDPASYRAADLECDLIMKGGITSGMVYPLAACRLATRYRFRQVGGASAGAIAAALTAAAEYQRQSRRGDAPNPDAGFLALATIPQVMGQRLSTLFQPAPSLRGAYDALTAWIEPDWSKGRKVRHTLSRIVGGAPSWFFGVTLAALLPGLLVALILVGWPMSWGRLLVSLLVWLPGAMLLGLLAAGYVLTRDTLAKLPGNGFGFVRGLTEDSSPEAPLALTDWLTTWLDKVSGLSGDDGPLTFGHLYGADASAAYRALHLDESTAPASPLQRAKFAPEIELQMMTSCLTLGRPYVFPFHTKVFLYCPECWKAYFPASVMSALARTSADPGVKTQRVGGDTVPIDQHCIHHGDVLLQELPAAPDIPVVIGVRLSLSFPGLISAVPFQMVDFNRAEGKKGVVEAWFTDGGLTSNFPVHFFDSMWPGRPTFGINLADEHPDFPDVKVWRPTANASGVLPRTAPIDSLGSFAGAIVETMHNWVDNSAIPAPGFRDRVVELRTGSGEGGLNLKMKPETIAALSGRGDLAAQQLEDFDFDNHRWIRYRTAMSSLTAVLDRMNRSYPDYREFIEGRTTGSFRFSSVDSQDATRGERDRQATEKLMALVDEWREANYPAVAGILPAPRPELRPVMRQ